MTIYFKPEKPSCFIEISQCELSQPLNHKSVEYAKIIAGLNFLTSGKCEISTLYNCKEIIPCIEHGIVELTIFREKYKPDACCDKELEILTNALKLISKEEFMIPVEYLYMRWQI